VHPDKVKSTETARTKALAQRLFTVLQERKPDA
jgi:hypothetical protein